MSSIRVVSSALTSRYNLFPKSFADAAAMAAVHMANLVPNGDHSWLYTPSILATRKYMAKYYVGEYRKSDESPEETHPIEVADWTINHVSKKILDTFGREFVAYVMYCHDVFENYNIDIRDFINNKKPAFVCYTEPSSLKKTINAFVNYTWKGDPELKNDAALLLYLFTDTPNLYGQKRLDQQILRANREKTGIIAEGRYWDKKTAFLRDHKTTLNCIIPFNGDLDKCASYILHRVELVAALRHKTITPEMKESLFIVGKNILDNAEAIKRYNQKPARNIIGLRKKMPKLSLM